MLRIDEALHRRMREVKDGISAGFLARSDVTGIGVGLKLTGGRQTDIMSIFFCVKRKGRFAARNVLPSSIEGFPTDVIEADFSRDPFKTAPGGKGSPAVDPDRYMTLEGGISVAPSRLTNGSGTLGIVVTDTATRNPMILSNAHVLALSDGRARAGDPICQQSRADNPTGECNACATLSRWALRNVVIGGFNVGVDAAVALVRTDLRQVSPRAIFGIGGGVEAAPMDAAIGQVLSKRGRTTNMTSGVVGSISMDAQKPNLVMHNQIRIDTPQGRVAFAQPGDSGSICVTRENGKNYAVALLWGASQIAVASPLDAVLQEMAISL
jgi:hypothetical protein